ncbi:MAG: bacterioferritin [Candidatus Protistobacter heckmanni]|nr:bacterioferritin [Candidatus Protistobacter heckmanni]
MKGDKQITQALNAVLGNELVAINQYFLHARMYRNWGYEALNGRVYRESIRAMKRADKLIERILFLEGLPNLQSLDKLLIGEEPVEILGCDLKLVTGHVAALREAVLLTEQHKDFISRELLTEILEEDEEYLDWLETQQTLQKDLGMPNYLQSQLGESDGD